jgi:hypothetical protein
MSGLLANSKRDTRGPRSVRQNFYTGEHMSAVRDVTPRSRVHESPFLGKMSHKLRTPLYDAAKITDAIRQHAP